MVAKAKGQYEDIAAGIYYKRFRYYDPESIYYISENPVKLAVVLISMSMHGTLTYG